MLQIGIQTKNVVYDSCPEDGYEQADRYDQCRAVWP